MAWLELTEEMVNEQWTAEEAAALAALNGGDKVPGILAKVIAQVRDDILAGGFELAADAVTMPEGLHNDAIAITRWKVLTSLPGMEDLQTKHREQQNKDGLDKLKLIAAGKRRVDPPAGATNLVSPGTWNSENKFNGRTNPVPRTGPSSAGRYANDDAPSDAP